MQNLPIVQFWPTYTCDPIDAASIVVFDPMYTNDPILTG